MLKIIVQNFRSYIQNSWNQFDFLVVLISCLDIIIQLLLNQSNLAFVGSLIKVFRIFRITRILKLIKSVEGLKRLVNTIVFSLPSMINVSQLIFLTYYIFSILASFLYRDITFKK